MGATDKKFAIYGTGEAATMAFHALTYRGYEPSSFIDADERKIGTKFCGIEIKNINQIPADTVVLIAANPAYGIHERVAEAGIGQWMYADPGSLCLWSEGYDSERIRAIFRENEDKIRMVYDMLADEMSKKVYHTILRHRMECDVLSLQDIYEKNQYFGNDVIGKVNGSIVDCGAYNGDTLRRFLAQASGEWHYYAFESDEQNYNMLLEYCDKNNIRNVDAYNIAVYDKNEKVSFSVAPDAVRGSGKIAGNEDERTVWIDADSIDNILGSKRVDMITMDIEGAEIHALYGARNCIEEWHPKLAVSAYHMMEHLWEIPILIKEMNPDYRIFFRHHCWNMHDTVVYAIDES